MSQIDQNTKAIFKNIKELLILAAKDRNHTFHTPVFSSNFENNSVNSRIVVIRKFDEDSLKINFHTDYRSPKILDLQKNSQTSFVFYDYKIKIQLRIKTLSIINHKNNISKHAWGNTPLSSRKCYLATKPPSSSTTLSEDSIPKHLKGINPTLDESEKGYENFTVIENKILNIDWLHLNSSGHQRLQIRLDNLKPVFNWIIP